MTDHHHQHIQLDPAITQVKMSQKKTTITMEELEKSMNSSSIVQKQLPSKKSSIDISKYYPIKRMENETAPPVYTFPPPLISAEEEQLARILQNSTWKCPPPPKPLEEWPFLKDSHRGTMSRYEREGISRMHLGQLSTDDPELEDYYYKNYTKQLHGSLTVKPLYLPIPSISQRRSKGNSEKQEDSSNGGGNELQEVFSRSLGHGSLSSSVTRKARQTLLQPSRFVMSTLLKPIENSTLDPTADNEPSNRYALPAMIEKLNELSNIIDYHLQQISPSNNTKDSILIATELSTYMKINLGIDERELGDLKEEQLLLFMNLLNSNQGLKALGKCIKTLTLTNSESCLLSHCLDRIIEIFEYLDVSNSTSSNHDLKSTFIDNIIASFVPFISCQSFPFIMKRMELLTTKKEDSEVGKSEENLSFLLQSRVALVLFCVLMSRAEIMMKEDGLLSDDQKQGYCIVVHVLFTHLIQNNICDLLFTSSSSSSSDDDDLFYTWQFLALLSLNIDSEGKKTIVMELREKIMQVIEASSSGKTDEKAISNLNVFLNALGLDASQLG